MKRALRTTMTNPTNGDSRIRRHGGLVIGICLGTALGVAMGKLAIGVAIGVALGLGLDAAIASRPSGG